MIRVLRCDDCPYSGRYIGDTGFDRAQRHAEEFRHRTRVLPDEGSGKEGAVYDYRSKESDTGSDE